MLFYLLETQQMVNKIKINESHNKIRVTLDNKTSPGYICEIFTSCKSRKNKISVDIWVVRIGLYLVDVQFFKTLESEGEKNKRD